MFMIWLQTPSLVPRPRIHTHGLGMRLTNATPQLHALGDHIICIGDFLSNNTGLTFAKYQSNTHTITLATGLDANNRNFHIKFE